MQAPASALPGKTPKSDKLTIQAFRALIKDGITLEKDKLGPKVLILNDKTYLKIFRRQSNYFPRLHPTNADRFVENCEHLSRLGIPCPKVRTRMSMDIPRWDLVVYEPIDGESAKKLFLAGALSAEDLNRIRVFINKIQALGIYFRSLHLGNIISMSNGRFGLVDVSDLSLKNKPLNLLYRHRNRKHLLRDSVTREALFE